MHEVQEMTERNNRMEIKINNSILKLIKGDITHEETAAIVNAANESLIPGGGVDMAIHKTGGPAIKAQSELIGGCPTGQAVITTGGTLKAKYVIHAVGPMYDGGKTGEPELLTSAYRESLNLASCKSLESISFPSLSTGAFGYPLEEATQIALQTVIGFLKDTTVIKEVHFVLFDDLTYRTFEETLKKLTA
jgi:O-acetyl-ADP-ribose deacetylase (regulator of RNase III)